ncbi:hypothetical protein Btru_070732 [Bulinus truncatus]|nr:hypothetical protein Btru_070732 [Bulinus truncatus]
MIKYMKKVGTVKKTNDYGVVWLNDGLKEDAAAENPEQGTSKGSHTADNHKENSPEKESMGDDENGTCDWPTAVKYASPATHVWRLSLVVIWSVVRIVLKDWTNVQYVALTLNNGCERTFNKILHVEIKIKFVGFLPLLSRAVKIGD